MSSNLWFILAKQEYTNKNKGDIKMTWTVTELNKEAYENEIKQLDIIQNINLMGKGNMLQVVYDDLNNPVKMFLKQGKEHIDFFYNPIGV